MQTSFPDSAPAANPVFFRTYSRSTEDGRESWDAVVRRTVDGITELGELTGDESALLEEMQRELKVLPSGRWLWVGGTKWIQKPENFSGAYNCTSTNLIDWESFGLMMDLAMMGSGTGAVIEQQHVDRLPPIINKLNVRFLDSIGQISPDRRLSKTVVTVSESTTDERDVVAAIVVGDSRRGWVRAYTWLLHLASDPAIGGRDVWVDVILGHVRPAGERLHGFGGVSNPIKLPEMFPRVAAILNGAQGRQLTSVECCLLIDEAALVVVAGNVRRSAGMRQFSSNDSDAAAAKDNLWKQDDSGAWVIDHERDALRMANHTRVFHSRPSYEEVFSAVTKQFYSGEGAIQFAPEAIARGNADILSNEQARKWFISLYCTQGKEAAADYLKMRKPGMPEREVEHRLMRYGLNPCGEIIGSDFHCVDGNTKLIHRDGIDKISSLVGKDVDVWNGTRWSRVSPLLTGRNRKLYRVSLSDGSCLDVTEGHRWFVKDRFQREFKEVTTLELADLLSTSKYAVSTEPFKIEYNDGIDVDDAYTLGVLVGDGTTYSNNKKDYKSVVRLHGAKQLLPINAGTQYESITEGRVTTFCSSFDWDGVTLRLLKTSASAMLSLGSWSRKSILEFIAGLADTDGNNTISGGIRIYLSDRDRAEAVYLLLLKCGIRSSINLASRAGTVTNYGARKRDLYYLQITDCAAIPCHRLDTRSGHSPIMKGKTQVVRSVVELPGLHDTYCFNEPEHHKGVFGGTLTGQCNLSEVHLNQIDPDDGQAQAKAFEAAALAVASLLHHRFEVERYSISRELDPIVGVSFTGLFDFFVQAFGTPWLQWWAAGRPDTDEGQEFKIREAAFLSHWKKIVHDTVDDYCQVHGLKTPNRCTTVQPAGTKSLLTGASPGWHPPKAQRFIRRITFRKDDPVALACLDYGYNVVPSQSDKDENGRLLDDPFDPRCTEWLVEIPTEVSWANLRGADAVDISGFSALAQFDFYMQVQRHYTAHNTSATIEYREHEIEPLARRIHQAIEEDEGYISAALLARFDANETFPRLPFEPIDRETFHRLEAEVLSRRKTDDFFAAIRQYDHGVREEAGPAGCDSDKCLLPLAKREVTA